MGLRSSRLQRLRVPESNHEESIQMSLPITSNNNELDQIVPEINVSISFIYLKYVCNDFPYEIPIFFRNPILEWHTQCKMTIMGCA